MKKVKAVKVKTAYGTDISAVFVEAFDYSGVVTDDGDDLFVGDDSSSWSDYDDSLLSVERSIDGILEAWVADTQAAGFKAGYDSFSEGYTFAHVDNSGAVQVGVVSNSESERYRFGQVIASLDLKYEVEWEDDGIEPEAEVTQLETLSGRNSAMFRLPGGRALVTVSAEERPAEGEVPAEVVVVVNFDDKHRGHAAVVVNGDRVYDENHTD